jgi:hypothetical protein
MEIESATVTFVTETTLRRFCFSILDPPDFGDLRHILADESQRFSSSIWQRGHFGDICHIQPAPLINFPFESVLRLILVMYVTFGDERPLLRCTTSDCPARA